MSQRTLVIHPYLKQKDSRERSPQGRLAEAIGLARAIELEIVSERIVPVSDPKPATLIGQGKIEELQQLIEDDEIKLVVMNSKLTPVQQRNLEKAWNCKVIDRTALILEIFGARARTAEGKLQVELASLNYQKSRLVRSWTHLERQRGGFGFLGGPGESQIETDRRLIRDRITKIKRELETVVRTRELHRKTRREIPYPVVALVGYTNAGKSTLFNRLTGASVEAVDKLFATLDPTIRSLKLASGITVMLSDTVGFVSDLPHDLVAAFRATLEEVLEADLILHVRDISHEESTAQKHDVEDVLKDLFKADETQAPMLEVWNKTDLLPEDDGRREPPPSTHDDLTPVAVSAVTGQGIDALFERLERILETAGMQTAHYRLPAGNGKEIAWLHSHGKVIEQTEDGEYIDFTVRLSPQNLARFEKMQKAG